MLHQLSDSGRNAIFLMTFGWLCNDYQRVDVGGWVESL